MNLHRTFATTIRVLTQLRHDHRSVALVLLMPSVLMGLFAWLFIDQEGVFNQFGPPMLVLFPFTLMFVVTSITTLRERRSGTLERLMTMPLGKADFIAGYALAFSLIAIAQAAVTVSISVWLYGLEVDGSILMLGLVAVLNGILGTSLGLLASAFARTEFQAVQFMPLLVFPQVIIGGVLLPRGQMPEALQVISDWLPLSYAVEAANAATTGAAGEEILQPAGIILLFILGSLVLASLTLSRKTQ